MASISVGNSIGTVYNDAVVGIGQDIASGLLGSQVFFDPMGRAISEILSTLGAAISFSLGILRDALPILEAGIFIESTGSTIAQTISESAALAWASSGINEPIDETVTVAAPACATCASVSGVVTTVIRQGGRVAKYPIKLVHQSGRRKIYAAGHAMLGKFNRSNGILSSVFQKNHLSQDAAFRNLGPRGGIPYGQGLSVNVKGSVSDVGSQHYKFHQNLDAWWAKFRGGTPPTVGQYNRQLTKSLEHAGFRPEEARKLARLAEQQQQAYGILANTRFNGVPGPTV